MEHCHHARKFHWTQDCCLSSWAPADGFPSRVCSAAVCFGKWGLQQRGESSRAASHCDMSEPLLQSLQHEQGKRYFWELAFVSSFQYHDFSGYAMPFHGARRLLLLPQASRGWRVVWPQWAVFIGRVTGGGGGHTVVVIVFQVCHCVCQRLLSSWSIGC